MVPTGSNVGNAMWLMPRTGWLGGPAGAACCSRSCAVGEVTCRFLPVFCAAEYSRIRPTCQRLSHKLDELVAPGLSCRHVPGTCRDHRRGPGGPVRRAAHQGAD